MDALAPIRPTTDRPALEGNLSDLRPIELLRLLHQTRQTGTLQVLAGGPVLLTLVDGAVSYATTDPNRTLRDVLDDEGVLDAAAWERAATGTSDDLGVALVAAGMPESTVIEVLRRVVLDVVADLALAPQGRFRFVAGRRHSLGDRFHYPPAQLERDLEGRVAEWERIRAVLPSFDCGARLARALPPGQGDVQIIASDWRVMVAVDGAATLEDARASLGCTRFALARSLAALVRAGALQLVDAGA
jgi:hypothetical protein